MKSICIAYIKTWKSLLFYSFPPSLSIYFDRSADQPTDRERPVGERSEMFFFSSFGSWIFTSSLLLCLSAALSYIVWVFISSSPHSISPFSVVQIERNWTWTLETELKVICRVFFFLASSCHNLLLHLLFLLKWFLFFLCSLISTYFLRFCVHWKWFLRRAGERRKRKGKGIPIQVPSPIKWPKTV